MASISKDPNGNRTIQFIAGDGKRRSIRLGKLPVKATNEIKTKVEALNAASIAGIGWDKETAEWVGGRAATLYDKLAAVGLVPKRAEPEKTTLGHFLDNYIALRSDVKDSTSAVYGHTQRCLIEYFTATKPLADITAGAADAWRIWLGEHEGLGESTIKRRCGIAKQFFRAAQRRKLIAENPFGDMKGISTQRNRARYRFVSRAEADKVLAACPDAQWRLLFALSRFAGLRCPSEHLGLRWCDVDWERGRMTIHSPKTARHEGKASRVVPIFPELRPYLEQVFDDAEPGTYWVITRYRDRNSNLRTQLERIIAKAGLQPWPKLFQNLRSTRQTELAEQFPQHVCCAWIGNSEDVAREHYLQLTDEHFERAIQGDSGALHNPVQLAAETPCSDSQTKMPHPVASEECDRMRQCTSVPVGGTRLELVTPSLSSWCSNQLS